MSRLQRMAPRCYFCPGPSREPVVYVRWRGRRHYGFLCALHRAEHAEHVVRDYTVAEGLRRCAAVVQDEERRP